MVAPLLVVAVALFVVPLLALLRYSFNVHVPGRFMIPAWTLANYAKFARASFFWQVTWVTIEIGLVTTLLALLFGYPLAYFFARRPSFRALQMSLLVAPLLVNIVVRVYGWRVLLSDVGLLNRALTAAGVIHEPIGFMNSISGVVIALVHVLLPYMVLSIASVLEGVDVALEEAAATLGASPWVRFRRVLLPLSMPGIVAGSVLVFTHAAGSFVVPALMGGGRVKTIPTLMYQYTLGLMNWPFGAALAFVMASITLVALMTYSRVSLRGVVAREAVSA
jgi:putative spermidine/putrescine transport system permease protein